MCHHLSQASGSPIPMLHPFFFDEPHRVLDTVLLVLGTSKIIWFKGSESPTSQLTLCYSTLQNILKAPKKNPLGLFQMMASDEHPWGFRRLKVDKVPSFGWGPNCWRNAALWRGRLVFIVGWEKQWFLVCEITYIKWISSSWLWQRLNKTLVDYSHA